MPMRFSPGCPCCGEVITVPPMSCTDFECVMSYSDNLGGYIYTPQTKGYFPPQKVTITKLGYGENYQGQGYVSEVEEIASYIIESKMSSASYPPQASMTLPSNHSEITWYEVKYDLYGKLGAAKKICKIMPGGLNSIGSILAPHCPMVYSRETTPFICASPCMLPMDIKATFMYSTNMESRSSFRTNMVWNPQLGYVSTPVGTDELIFTPESINVELVKTLSFSYSAFNSNGRKIWMSGPLNIKLYNYVERFTPNALGVDIGLSPKYYEADVYLNSVSMTAYSPGSLTQENSCDLNGNKILYEFRSTFYSMTLANSSSSPGVIFPVRRDDPANYSDRIVNVTCNPLLGSIKPKEPLRPITYGSSLSRLIPYSLMNATISYV